MSRTDEGPQTPEVALSCSMSSASQMLLTICTYRWLYRNVSHWWLWSKICEKISQMSSYNKNDNELLVSHYYMWGNSFFLWAQAVDEKRLIDKRSLPGLDEKSVGVSIKLNWTLLFAVSVRCLSILNWLLCLFCYFYHLLDTLAMIQKENKYF